MTGGPSPLEVLAGLPARARLMVFTMSRVAVQVIWALAELGIPDLLADGPRPAAELAERTGTDPGALARMLQAATAVDALAELPDGTFALTEMSHYLRSDGPHSVRDLVRMNGSALFWRPYEAILHSARTGRPAFAEVFGRPLFEHLEGSPRDAELFHRAMAATSDRGAGVAAGLLDLSGCSRVADLGGGHGRLLAELLARHPRCKGVLFDRPAALAGAAEPLAERGVADRVDLVAGDFFAEVPPGCDAYILKLVLHDWPDGDAVRILRNVRAALAGTAGGRLFVIEHLVGAPNTLDVAKLLDMDMLVVLGGRERTLAEMRGLAAAADFDLAVGDSAAGLTALELTPR